MEMTTQNLTSTTPFGELTDSQKLLVLSIGLNNVQNKLDNHDKILITGNGNLPIVERLRNVESFIGSIKYWTRFLVGAILIQTLTFAAAAITYFIRLYPLLVKLSERP